MRNFRITQNTSKWPTDEIMPLVNLAWDAAWTGLDSVKKHPSWSHYANQSTVDLTCVFEVQITACKRGYRGRAWGRRCLLRLGHPSIYQMAFPKPLNYWRYKDMPEYAVNSWEEIIVMIAAHEFAHLTGYDGNKDEEHSCEIVAWDAIDAYRKQKAEIDGRTQAIRDRKAQRAESAQAREKLKAVQDVSLDFRFAKLDTIEKRWPSSSWR
jgi:hypothetical protein